MSYRSQTYYVMSPKFPTPSPKRPVTQTFFAKTSCRLNDWWPLTRSKSVAVLGARRTRYLHTAVLLAQKQLPPVWLPSLLVWVGSDPQNKCIMGQCIACSEKNATVTLNDARTLTSVRSHQLFSFSKTSTSLLFFFIVVGRRNDLLNCHQTLRCWFDAALIIASPPSSALEHTIYQRHVRTAVNLLYIA